MAVVAVMRFLGRYLRYCEFFVSVVRGYEEVISTFRPPIVLSVTYLALRSLSTISKFKTIRAGFWRGSEYILVCLGIVAENYLADLGRIL